MAQGKRNRLSAEQRADMWRRWKAGESLHEIGRAFGKGHGSIRFLLTQRGGIVPAVRRRQNVRPHYWQVSDWAEAALEESLHTDSARVLHSRDVGCGRVIFKLVLRRNTCCLLGVVNEIRK